MGHLKSRFENYLTDNRQVRIFLSSTFFGMQEERDALIQTLENEMYRFL
jgi:hypothetical protein